MKKYVSTLLLAIFATAGIAQNNPGNLLNQTGEVGVTGEVSTSPSMQSRADVKSQGKINNNTNAKKDGKLGPITEEKNKTSVKSRAQVKSELNQSMKNGDLPQRGEVSTGVDINSNTGQMK